jgi:hypothetical protein
LRGLPTCIVGVAALISESVSRFSGIYGSNVWVKGVRAQSPGRSWTKETDGAQVRPACL